MQLRLGGLFRLGSAGADRDCSAEAQRHGNKEQPVVVAPRGSLPRPGFRLACKCHLDPGQRLASPGIGNDADEMAIGIRSEVNGRRLGVSLCEHLHFRKTRAVRDVRQPHSRRQARRETARDDLGQPSVGVAQVLQRHPDLVG